MLRRSNHTKIYDGNKTWIGEWIGGPQPEYFFGRRRRSLNGLLVAEMASSFGTTMATASSTTAPVMSEYDIQASKVFANGLVARSLFRQRWQRCGGSQRDEGLMFWIDDGDGKTEEGELQPLSKFGITEIRIPAGDKTLKTEYKQARKTNSPYRAVSIKRLFQRFKITQPIVFHRFSRTHGREFVLGGKSS